MYWNNPLISLCWPGSQDPVAEMHHTGTHCLFWNPCFDFRSVHTEYTLIDFCHRLNSMLDAWGVAALDQDNRVLPGNQYAFTNMVKFNIWVADLRQRGNIKPWLIQDQGNGSYSAGTGDSRLKCLEVIPEITHVEAFISTRSDRAHLYQDLEPVTTLDQFARLCQAQDNDRFMFRMTDSAAPYGVYWYEHQNSRTQSVTPSDDEALMMLRNYLNQNPNTRASTDWFGTAIDWDSYRL